MQRNRAPTSWSWARRERSDETRPLRTALPAHHGRQLEAPFLTASRFWELCRDRPATRREFVTCLRPSFPFDHALRCPRVLQIARRSLPCEADARRRVGWALGDSGSEARKMVCGQCPVPCLARHGPRRGGVRPRLVRTSDNNVLPLF